MELSSLTFIAFASLVALLANAFPAPASRRAILTLASATFIASYASAPVQLLPLAAFVAAGYLVLLAVQARPSRGVLWAGLTTIVVAFIYLKRFSFIAALPTLPFLYLSLGLSYILFRIIHLIVDTSQGEFAERIPPLAYLEYTCNFLSFVSGPIQRYPDYRAASEKRLELDEEVTFDAFARTIRGYIKIAVVSAVANHLFTALSGRLLAPGGSSLTVAAALYATTAMVYAIYLYYNFSGYMDIVIGVGRLLGYDLPENFNKPFSSHNFLEFWSRWHITLSDWFKTYVFNPLLKLMAVHVQAKTLQPFLGVAAFFFTFLLIGMWHGTTTVFFIYGLLLGACASINKLWQVLMTRRLGKQRYKSLCAKASYTALCMGMTFTTFAFALTCFWVDMAQLQALAAKLGVAGVVMAYLLLSAASGIVLWSLERLAGKVVPVVARLTEFMNGTFVRNSALAAEMLVIACVASFFHKAPEFVYRAF